MQTPRWTGRHGVNTQPPLLPLQRKWFHAFEGILFPQISFSPSMFLNVVSVVTGSVGFPSFEQWGSPKKSADLRLFVLKNGTSEFTITPARTQILHHYELFCRLLQWHNRVSSRSLGPPHSSGVLLAEALCLCPSHRPLCPRHRFIRTSMRETVVCTAVP